MAADLGQRGGGEFALTITWYLGGKRWRECCCELRALFEEIEMFAEAVFEFVSVNGCTRFYCEAMMLRKPCAVEN